MISALKNIVTQNNSLKQFIHSLIVSNYRPRLWVRLFWNPFVHTIAFSSTIRWSVRRDLFPFNAFKVGHNTIIESRVTLNNAVGDLEVGDNCVIGIGNTIIGPVEIGNDVILAQNIVISALNHNYENPEQPIVDQGVNTKKIQIKSEAWIGANVVIVPGVTIGKHSVIGAGSVVTKSVPDYHIAVGNPAKLVKRFNFGTQKWEKIHE
ncbi:acyltransferase [Flammeovirga agarivorans]|uniref:Acyltransferase n=1 Tax=Flammeovirga agarivorans TaxID=2726742 RepID=A0A7X8SQK3_9BACT|nr:acyltransferase [Flammeovirga agarivorans]NLR94589.1 acyltransferase [Flammeovirga agarivorans]